MARETKTYKAADARVDRVYRENCSGVQVNIMDIPKIFRVGHAAIAEGADDTVLKEKIVAYVETIRKN
jgi:hypothetical protein